MKTSFLVRGCNFAFCLPLFILAFCTGVGTAHGQTEELPKVDAKNSLVKGAGALQFQINDNFSLSSFQGSTLSAKRHYSNKKAIRFGVSLSGGISEQDQISGVPSIVGPKYERDENSQSIGITTQYAIYPSPENSANFFLGAGPFVRFSHFNRTENSSNNISSTKTSTKSTGWGAGITDVVGVEWFATRDISFIAEYGSALGYNSDGQTEKTEQKTGTSPYVAANAAKTNSKDLHLSSGFVKFGLSVYF